MKQANEARGRSRRGRGSAAPPVGGSGSAACWQRPLPRLPRAGMPLPSTLAPENARYRGLWGVAAGGVNMFALIARWPARGTVAAACNRCSRFVRAQGLPWPCRWGRAAGTTPRGGLGRASQPARSAEMLGARPGARGGGPGAGVGGGL